MGKCASAIIPVFAILVPTVLIRPGDREHEVEDLHLLLRRHDGLDGGNDIIRQDFFLLSPRRRADTAKRLRRPPSPPSSGSLPPRPHAIRRSTSV